MSNERKQSAYDFYTGLATLATDVDNNVSVATEYDALGRPTKVRSAAGTPLESQVRTEYNDIARRVIARSDLETIGDGKKVAVQHYDQLGRVRLSRSIENIVTEDPYNEAHGIKVETRYQTGNPNSYQLTSNPFRAATATAATTEQSMGWTRSKSWNTGRKQEIETFSGSALPAPWGNNANSTGIVTTDIDADRTLATDQAGKQRISRTNALGQLKDIWEVTAPDANTEPITFGSPAVNLHGYKTSYSYDTLNNLTTVNQGVQTRSFSYNSLSRLLSATNPESGSIQYQYDNNGNLTQKTDARVIVTNYVYDALDRVTQRNYTAPGGLPNYQATPNVSYFYDNLPNAKGKLTKVSSSVSTTEYTEFDILGRVKAHKQTTDANAYTTGYVYNLSGALIEETYPSGRVVKNILDNDGDLSQVQSRKLNGTFRNYANSFNYTAAGAVSSMRLGNGKWESTQFNSRLQPTQIALGGSAGNANLLKLDFSYGTTANNGNVLNQTITVNRSNQSPLVFNQTYVYDSLNRLKSAEEISNNVSTWKQAYTFDRYGNRRFDQANTSQPASFASPNITNPTMDIANNKFTTGQGYTYDAAGNVITDAEGRTFTYDAESKQKEARNSGNATLGTYFFDGDGKRVKKVVPATGETTIFVYDAGGKLVAEYSTTLSPTPQVQYLTNDNLGTPRINTDQNGNVVSRSDYLPYGEEIVALGGRLSADKYVADDVRQGFTGYISDDETGLEFAQARMYKNELGRFTGADPLLTSGRLSSPQTWNRYSYVLNNPLALIDPDGLYECTGDKCKEFRNKLTSDRDKLEGIKAKYGEKSDEYKKAKKSLAAYGCESSGGKCVDANGMVMKDSKGRALTDSARNVKVSFGNIAGGNTSINTNKDRNIYVTLSSDFGSNSGIIGNEGINVAAFQDYLKTGRNESEYQAEFDGLFVQAVYGELDAIDNKLMSDGILVTAVGSAPPYVVNTWEKAWETPDHETVRSKRKDAINQILKEDKNYGLTPDSKSNVVTIKRSK